MMFISYLASADVYISERYIHRGKITLAWHDYGRVFFLLTIHTSKCHERKAIIDISIDAFTYGESLSIDAKSNIITGIFSFFIFPTHYLPIERICFNIDKFTDWQIFKCSLLIIIDTM